VNRRQARHARRIAGLVIEWRGSVTARRRRLLLEELPTRYLNDAWIIRHLTQPAERVRARRYWN
jgi:hypothetical protein